MIEKICHGMTTIPAKTDRRAVKIRARIMRRIEVDKKKTGNRECKNRQPHGMVATTAIKNHHIGERKAETPTVKTRIMAVMKKKNALTIAVYKKELYSFRLASVKQSAQR
jgi:hypothetical protein